MNLGDLTNFVEKPFAAMSNIINTPNSAGRYRPFYLRNLLDAVQGRTLNDAVAGKTVLITGAGGSIGSELARQIARFRPARLVLLERAESPLYFVHLEVSGSAPEIEVVPVIANCPPLLVPPPPSIVDQERSNRPDDWA